MEPLSTNLNIYFIIIDEQNPDNSFCQRFWCKTCSAGLALATVMAQAWQNGLQYPYPILMGLASEEEVEAIANDPMMRSADNVLWDTNVFSYPYSATFRLPYGVINTTETQSDAEEPFFIKSYQTHTRENDLYELIVNVNDEDLLDDYRKLLSLYTTYRGMWIEFHNLWFKNSDQRVGSEKFNTADAMIEFIQINDINLLKNGFVTLTAYLDEGETNISIALNKQIRVLSYSKEVIGNLVKRLNFMGYEFNQNLIVNRNKAKLWHYRHPDGLEFDELVLYLIENGFHLVEN